MRIHRRFLLTVYVLTDYVVAALAWTMLYVYRKLIIEDVPWEQVSLAMDPKFIYAVLFIPVGWVVFYAIFGTYSDLYRKSRLAELGKTAWMTFVGVVILFFFFILDDVVIDYRNYYQSFFFLLTAHFLLTFIGRYIWLTVAKRQLERGAIGYNALFIGGDSKAIDTYKEITSMPRKLGYQFQGFIYTNGKSTNGLAEYLPELGRMDDIGQVISDHQIDEVIICVETSEHPKLRQIINALADHKVVIKIVPDMYDILSGSVKMRDVLGAVLIEIYPDLMPQWQRVIKRSLDIIGSLCAIILLSPILIFAAIRVKLSSPGPVMYKQERIGKGGRPFHIYKFRSMYVDAEQNGPQLSSKEDPRITPWGRVMRKWRIDELPQFFNILKGEMSLVGPRPERKYFIDQIVQEAPAYRHLQKVKPGLTSWGMVKFGYAENVEEMIERMKYDLLYIENMSLVIDFKIMIYTVLTIIQGKGK